MIKRHERSILVQKHQCDFNGMMLDFLENRDISYIELLIILNEYVRCSVLKYMLRQERHPDDPDKRADEE